MAQHHGSTGDPAQDMDGREAMLEDSLADVFAAYDRARRDGVRQPVVFLIDCEDEIGGPLARAWEGDDAVDAAVMAHAESASSEESAEVATTLARGCPWEDCRREVPHVFPYLAATFAQPPPSDAVLVVVVAFGGAATFTAPHRVPPAEDQA